MTDHYADAERLLRMAEEASSPEGYHSMIAAAQVHATLATVPPYPQTAEDLRGAQAEIDRLRAVIDGIESEAMVERVARFLAVSYPTRVDHARAILAALDESRCTATAMTEAYKAAQDRAAELLAEREPVVIRTAEDLGRLHGVFVDLPWWHIAVESENGSAFIVYEHEDGRLRYVKNGDEDSVVSETALPFTVLSPAAVRAYRATTGEAGQ